MNTTLIPEADPTTTDLTTTDRAVRPVAQALSASVEAVRDSLAHMDDGAVLSVPIGTPNENFDVVEWCATNRKPVINRFDPWPLETLLVRNTPSNDTDDTDDTDDTEDPAAPTAPASERSGASVEHHTTRRTRRGLRRFRRNLAGDRPLDRAWHDSGTATTRSRLTVGIV